MTFAHKTDVPVSRSRGEIERVLRSWDCDGIQWTDDYRSGVATLRFRWTFEDVDYQARMTVRLPPDDSLYTEHERKSGYRMREVTDTQMQKRRDQRWRSLHRVLLLTIKANLNSVAAGLVTAVEAFLPHLEGRDGRTVAELAIPRLRLLAEQGGSQRLLE